MSVPSSETRAHIERLAMGYGPAAILFSAVELGVFDHLSEGPLEVPALARRLGASASGVARLGAALCALGLVHRDADGLLHGIPHVTALLSSSAPDSLAPVMLYHQRHIAPLMGRLGEAVRHQRSQHEAWPFASESAAERTSYQELTRHPGEYALFIEAMDRFAIGAGKDIAARFDLSGVRRLVDLGGGSGRIACELLEAAPHLEIEMVDLEPACAFATERARSRNLGDRFRATAADLTVPLTASVEKADAVLLAGILSDLAPEGRLRLLENAASLLKPGSALLVNETLLDDDRNGPTVPVFLSVLLMVAVPGDSVTFPELRTLLGTTGFHSIEHRAPAREGGRDLVVARR